MVAKRLPTGVTIRGNSIQIAFTADRTRHREVLKLPPTPTNIKYAERLRAEILRKVELRSFSLAEYFPNSKHAPQGNEVPTVSEMFEKWIGGMVGKSHTTIYGYRSAFLSTWLPAIGGMRLDSIKPSDIKAAIAGREWKSLKTLNNYMIPLRGMFSAALDDELIETSPMQRIKSVPYQTPEPDPMTLEEVSSVLAFMAANYPAPVSNYFQFAFFSGLRTGELIALRWADVDFAASKVRVEVSRTYRRLKKTKTSKIRYVDLNSQSLAALVRQKEHSFLADKEVFTNPATGRAWVDDMTQRERFWKPALRKLGMRQRDAYQTRHTFATMCLMAGSKPPYIAAQLGHANAKMLWERYGRWINGADRGHELGLIESAIGKPAADSRKKTTN